MEKEYDDFYQIGNAKVFIISPERVLGKKNDTRRNRFST